VTTEVTLPIAVSLNGTGCDSTQVGGKGTGLERLVSHGLPIPKSFAITTSAYRSFVEAQGLTRWIVNLDASSLPHPEDLSRASAEVEQVFLDGSIPEATYAAIAETVTPLLAAGTVAVRSSATSEDLGTASFAGQYRSFMGVADIDAVVESVRRCWASLWLPAARAYRRQREIDSADLAMAVILQEMVEPDWSGVGFTRDPRGVPNAMRIEMVPGLGEALVSGRVTPRDFVIRRSNLAVRSGSGQAAPVFMEDLSRMLLQVEHLLDEPQDVEWAYADGEIILLQSRPITVTGPMTILDDGFDCPVGSADTFTPSGVVEMLPGVLSPLLWTINAGMLENAFRDVVDSLGDVPIRDGRRFVARFGGRAALNLSALQDVALQLPGGSPADVEMQLLGHAASEEVDVDASDRRSSFRSQLRSRRMQSRTEDEVDVVSGAIGGILDLQVDLAALPASGLLAYQHSVRDLAWRTYSAEVAASSAATANYRSLEKLIGRWLDDGDAEEWAQRLTAGTLSQHAVGVVRTNQLRDVYKRHLANIPDLRASLLARPRSRCRDRVEELGVLGRRFLDEVDRIIRDQGSLTVYGGSTSSDHAEGVWQQLVVHAEVDSPPSPQMTREETHDALMNLMKGSRRWKTLRVLTGQIIDLRERWIRRQTNEAIHMLRLRERAKSALLSLGGEERRIILEGAGRLVKSRQLVAPEDAWLLSDREFRSMLVGTPSPPESVLHRRLSVRQECLDEGPLPARFVGSPRSAPNIDVPDASTMRGWAASPGVVVGCARIVMTIDQGGNLHGGDILVAPTTDASWTPLMLTAGGLVLEEGGPLSHGAIIAREFGLPAVLNIPRVTEALVDGETIEVDGFAGLVRRIHMETERKQAS